MNYWSQLVFVAQCSLIFHHNVACAPSNSHANNTVNSMNITSNRNNLPHSIQHRYRSYLRENKFNVVPPPLQMKIACAQFHIDDLSRDFPLLPLHLGIKPLFISIKVHLFAKCCSWYGCVFVISRKKGARQAIVKIQLYER